MKPAEVLAARCRSLRDAVAEVLARPGSRLGAAMREWRARYFAGVDDERLAEAYAQTVACASLMTRADVAEAGLARALAVLTDEREEIAGPLQELGRAADGLAVRGGEQGSRLCEELLAAYDAGSRAELGAFYTPVEVVRAQIELVRAVLAERLGRPLGFADPGVRTIDPACGTGVYPWGIVTSTLEHVRKHMCEAAVAEAAARLADNLVALEIMPGPCTVARIRLAGLLGRAARVEPRDTLGSPAPDAAGRVVVCIGNPPYDRRAGAAARRELLADFLPARASGKHAKNLYNDYVYFWRWALRHACEGASAGGIVCFVTASSYLRGPGFAAMRRHMRAVLGELWIIDLGGDARGPRRSANVFAVTTPVCIAVALGRLAAERDAPARVWYTRLADDLGRARKLEVLGRVRSLRDLEWTRAPDGWEDPFVPAATGDHATWPRLADLFPWQHSGAQWKRTWPVGETPELLEQRWRTLLAADDRRAGFRETEAFTIDRVGVDLVDDGVQLPAIASLTATAATPPIRRYSWRALDRQWCLADGRLGDRLRPTLWRAHGERQIYLTTLMSTGLSRGPAAIACAHVPDLHHFRGSFGDKGVIPLWRDRAATQPNVAAGLLDALAGRLGRAVAPEELLAYVYGCLAHPGYVDTLAPHLAEPGPRVPVTADPRLFARAVELGRELLRLHTFGERMRAGDGPRLAGAARCVAAIPDDGLPERAEHRGEVLSVGRGRFAPVSQAVWSYEVSGLRVLRSWLGYRMRAPRGRSSSPLDALRPGRWTPVLTQELLELLWVLEGSIELHRRQEALLAEIVAGPLVPAVELPRPREAERRPP